MRTTGQRRAFAYPHAVAVLLTLSGCASHNKQPNVVAGAEGEGTRSDSSERADLPPLTPVAAPPGVVVRFRVAQPSKTADSILGAMSLPVRWESLELWNEVPYFQALDLDAALEGAVVLNPRDPTKPLRFVSLGAKNVDAVLKALEKQAIVAEEAPGGVFHFQFEGEPCAVGRSLGRSSARVVCSDEVTGLRDMVDYALRGLPGEHLSDAQAYIQADLRPVRSRYEQELGRVELLASVGARQLHVGHPKLDRALTDAAIGVAEELSDLIMDSETIEAEFNEKGGDLALSLQFHFSGERSTLVRTLREHQSTQGPAPVLFQGLPRESSAAQYGREITAQRAEPWMSVLTDLTSGWAEHRGANAEFSNRLARLARAFGPSSQTRVWAQGPLLVGDANGKKHLRAEWSVLGTTQSKEEVVQALDDLSWLLGSKELDKLLPETGYTPKLQRLAAAIPGAQGAVTYRWELPEQAEEAVAELSEVEGSDQAVDLWMDGHVSVLEYEGVTWVAWSPVGGPAELGRAFSVVTNPTQTLVDLPAAKDVLQAAALAGGFYKIDGLASLISFTFPTQVIADWDGLVRATPGRAAIPVSFLTRVELAGSATHLTYDLAIPHEFARDAASLVTMILAELDVPKK